MTLGIIGIFLPLLPTTPFALAASILFSSVNPRLNRWLLKNRLLGPYLDNYYNKRGISLGYKIWTCSSLWVGLITSMILVDLLAVRILLVCIGIGVSIHVISIKTKKKESLHDSSKECRKIAPEGVE